MCRRNGSLVRVLVFHDVLDAKWFEKIISLLSERYNIITPKEFVDSVFDSRRINILITFDDGYASWNTVCLPVLERYGVTAIFFINSGIPELWGNEAGLQAYLRENLLISPHTTLSWNDVSELVEAGHAIGGHTVHHPQLSRLPEEVQKDEVMSDKVILEKKLGVSVPLFAYPFGERSDYTEMTKKIVEGAGYSHAFTTSGRFIDHTDNYAVSRMCVEDAQPTGSLNRWILGGYDIYRMIKNICAR